MPISRVLPLLTLALIGVGPGASSLLAQNGDGTAPLELTRSWGGMRWSHEGGERQNLFGVGDSA